jgi:hypothetical protein
LARPRRRHLPESRRAGRALGTLGAGLCGLLAGALAADAAEPAIQSARLSPGKPLGDLPRIGVNLGGRSSWGAEQLMANVLQNPGLEAGQDGALVIVGRVSTDGIEDDTPWTARPAGFWAGAQFQVLSGAAAGAQGKVADNHRSSPSQGDTLLLSPPPRGVQPGDVIALMGEQDPRPAPLWWTEGLVRSVPEPRPGSPGSRSLRLQAVSGQPASLFYHLDTIGARAGKLLPVQGRWRLSLWARGAATGTPLKLSFGRHGRPAWLTRDVIVGTEWQRFELDFNAVDDGPAEPLMLALSTRQGSVWLDDLALGRATPDSPGGFRPEVVAALKQLRPGYLRDWQGQLADTPDNRLAVPEARHPIRYRPGKDDWLGTYSLPEFLALCAAVGANPWIILPSTSSPEDARQIGRSLSTAWAQHHFTDIVVEHGNEHWNGIFRPAGVAQPQALGELVDRSFAALKEGAGPQVPLHRVVGAQFVNPQATLRLVDRLHQVDRLAVAPYVHHEQAQGVSTQQALDQALAEDLRALQPLQDHHLPAPDVYEVNLHTLGGTATAAERQAVLLSPQAGTVLMQRLLQAAQQGVQRQSVYTLTSFDSLLATPPGGSIPLFGLARDLTEAGHWRPTGLALQALNQVIGGPAQAGACQGTACQKVTAVSFQGGSRWAVTSAATQDIDLRWPCLGPQQLHVLGAAPGRATCDQGWAQARLPARGWTTIHPAESSPSR